MKIKYPFLIIILLWFSFFYSNSQSSDQNYILNSEYLETVLVDDDFDTSFGGWLENGSVNYSLENGKLKANVNSSWEGVKNPLKGFKTIAGKTLKIKIDFDKGNTSSNVRLYLEERNPSGGFVDYNIRTNNLQTGVHEFTLDMNNSGNTIIFRVDKDNTNTSVETSFYINYISLQIDTNTDVEKLENVTYFDGFGKAKQSIAIRQSTNQKDLVQHIEYDEFGRPTKKYLPLPSNQNTGNYISNAKTQTYNYYNSSFSDQHPFSEVRYDNSPLNRRLESAAPGNTWQLLENSNNDHTTKYEYATNDSNDVYKIKINEQDTDKPIYLYDYTVSNVLINGYRNAQLFKNTFKNENWTNSDGLLNTKETYTDKNGKKIAEFNYEDDNGSVKKLSTYYVYDDNQNLRYVLPPKTFEYECNTNVDSDIIFNGHVSAPNNVDLVASNSITLNGGFAVDLGATFSANLSGTCGIIDNNTPCTGTYTKSFPYTDFVGSASGGRAGSINVNIYGNSSIQLHLNIFTYYSNTTPFLIPETPFDIESPCDIPDVFFGTISGSITAEITNGKLKFSNPNNESVQVLQGYFGSSLPVDFYTPKLTQQLLDDIAFQYKYDQYNRQIAQKVPGKDWESMVYDQLDRPILTQDANLKAQNKWMFNAYDVFGRVVYSGLYTNSASRDVLQAQVDNFINTSSNKANIVARTITTNFIGGISINYSNDAFPNSSLEILSVNYFDDYDFVDSDMPVIPTEILEQHVTTRTKGFATASWTKTLGSTTWSKDYTFYDVKGRVVKVYHKNHLGGYTENQSKYDFRSKIEKSITNHKRLASGTALTTIEDTFEYDHVERPLKHFQKINAQEIELLSSNIYNELGQLQSKGIGGDSANPLQTVDFNYNIRGWMTQMNDVNNLGQDLFAYSLKYNEATEGSASVANTYNGNIKQVIWKSAHGSSLKKSYAFEYDKLNRFKKSIYREGNTLTGGAGKFETSNLSYDANGNILGLSRWATSSIPIDNLSYHYDNGNKLVAIRDGSAPGMQAGFNNGSTGTSLDDYRYDANGNLIKDNNKNIANIQYNHLDLVERVTFNNGNKIEFDYDANGTKLQMRNIIAAGSTTTTDYLRGFQYTNAQLLFFPTSEGYAAKDGSTFKYVYLLRDHLGNNRVSFCDIDNGGFITPSNELLSNTDHYLMGMTHQGEYVSGLASNYNYRFQGKERLAFTDYNMYDFGSRMYDASVGRWFNPDPQNQFSSPYLAMGNHWVMGVDPNGEWFVIDDLIVGFVSGAGNLIGQAIAGNIDSWTDAGAYFGIGFVGGLTATYTGGLGTAAIISAGNSAYGQYDRTGSVDVQQLLFDTGIGTLTAGIAAPLGRYVGTQFSGVFSGIKSQLAKDILIQSFSGGAVGFGLGTASGLFSGQSLDDALNSGLQSGATGFANGAMTGAYMQTQPYKNKVQQQIIKDKIKNSNSQQQTQQPQQNSQSNPDLNQQRSIRIPAERQNTLPAEYSPYPKYDGAILGTKQVITLKKGMIIDRFGGDFGSYFAPLGTPDVMRSLPPTNDFSRYSTFKVIQPFQATQSVIAPYYGQPGFGLQYQTQFNVNFLLNNNYIQRVYLLNSGN